MKKGLPIVFVCLILSGSVACGTRETGVLDTEAQTELPPEKSRTADAAEDIDYVDRIKPVHIEMPVQRSPEEVLMKLQELGRTDSVIAEIFEKNYLYPENMLEALANNPEMAGFVAGYPEEEGKYEAVLTDSEKEQEYPLFLQWDPRWGYQQYGENSCIGLVGCGPTCLSMAAYYLTGDESLTPDCIAEFSMENDYYVEGVGTSWNLMYDFPGMVELSVEEIVTDEYEMKAALDSGNILICAMRPGDFTAGGHFIVIYGYEDDGFKVNDPNCVARSRRIWSFAELESQIKMIWSLGK